MADVEIVAEYKLYKHRPRKAREAHPTGSSPRARLEIEIEDRFGNPVVPREWFLVPLGAINDAVVKIKDGTIAAVRVRTSRQPLSFKRQ